MKFKNFLLSCSPGVHRKRLQDSSAESRYVNLRPISKRTSVPDFQTVSNVGSHSNSHGSTSKGNVQHGKSSSSKSKVDLKHSNSTSNFYVNCAGNENELPVESHLSQSESRSVFEPNGLPLPLSGDTS